MTDKDPTPTAASPGPISGRQMLKRLRDVMAGEGSAQERLDQIVRVIAGDIVAEVCSIYVRRSGQMLELCATEGLNPDAVHQTRLRIGEGLVGVIASTARPVALSEAQTHPNFAYRPETGEEIYHSFLGVPVLRSNRVLGVLAVQNRTHRHYNEDEIETLETFSMVLADLLANPEISARGEKSEDEAGLPVRIAGTVVSEGLGVGVAHLHQPRIIVRKFVAEDPDQEAERLEGAWRSMNAALDELLSADDLSDAGEHREVLETYRMIAQDAGWLRRVREGVNTGLTAEAAIQRTQNDMRTRFSQISDPYLRERLADFEDLSNRMLQELARDGQASESSENPDMPEDMVVIGRGMGPAELLEYDRDKLRGLVLEESTATAHVSIIARALEIPVVGRASGALEEVEPGDTVIVDGNHAQVFIRPGGEVLDQLLESQQTRAAQQQRYTEIRGLNAETLDGVRATLMINAGLLADIANFPNTGAEGIGLFRTEIPFMVRREYPDVSQQQELYARIYDGMGEAPVVFRTLDAGGDKKIQSFKIDPEENPAMGWRSLRIALDRPSMLRQQLRAMISAAAGRSLQVMFPMVTTANEFVQAKDLLSLEIARAEGLGRKMPSEVKVGAMLEVPAAVWDIDEILTEADFISVGSNDLFQFFYAVDRGSDKLSGRYDALSRPFLGVLREIATKCRQAGVPVTVCGEMAGRPSDALVLLALGFRRLSMSSSSVGPVKAMMRSIKHNECKGLIDEFMNSSQPNLRPVLDSYLKDRIMNF